MAGRKIITPSKIKWVPDLVAEILAPSSERNDRVLKFARYEKVGVPEYWIVDPFEHQVERHVLVDGKYSTSIHADEITCENLSPPVTIDLEKVWCA